VAETANVINQRVATVRKECLAPQPSETNLSPETDLISSGPIKENGGQEKGAGGLTIGRRQVYQIEILRNIKTLVTKGLKLANRRYPTATGELASFTSFTVDREAKSTKKSNSVGVDV